MNTSELSKSEEEGQQDDPLVDEPDQVRKRLIIDEDGFVILIDDEST